MIVWMMMQILVESLPISSSGHVALVQRWYTKLGYTFPLEQIEQINFLLHGPALIIMLFYFFTTWSHMIFGKKNQFQDFGNITMYKKVVKPAIFIGIVDIITFLFWKFEIFKIINFQNLFLTFGFFITVIMLYLTQFIQGNKEVNFRWQHAILLGIAQSVAFLPGISRFATTFFTARCLQYSLDTSFALSFLIQFPLVLAACIKGALQIYHNDVISQQIFNFWTLLGMVALTCISYVIFCFVGKIVQQNKIWYFSVYMILPIILSILI